MLTLTSKKFILIVLLPIVLYLGVFFYYAFGYNFVLSFHRTDLLTRFDFVGFRNFRNLFTDTEFHVSLRNNFRYWIGLVFGGLVIGLLFSWFISLTNEKFKKLFLALYFTPVVTSLVASSLIWKLMYYPDIGLFSTISKQLGFGSQGFLSDPKIALWCIVTMEIWKDLGIRIAIFLAALDQIPDSLYEAADIDGANELTKFLRISIPLIRPQILFVVVVFSINALRVFTQIYMMTAPPGGGPGNSTKVINLMLYQQSFRLLNFGFGASIAMIIFIMLFVFVLLQIKLMTKKD